jgi:hypothetical protein
MEPEGHPRHGGPRPDRRDKTCLPAAPSAGNALVAAEPAIAYGTLCEATHGNVSILIG